MTSIPSPADPDRRAPRPIAKKENISRGWECPQGDPQADRRASGTTSAPPGACYNGSAIRPALLLCLVVALAPALAGAAGADDDPAAMPYATPRQTLIPGTPGMAGGFHLMVNGFAHLDDPGLSGYTIDNPGTNRTFDAGRTQPLVTDDWVMGYGRDARGWVEGLLMLNFEPATVGSAGYPELGQSGEGLWDAQHAHQFLHQAMIAVHPLAGTAGGAASMAGEGAYDLSLFGGQGSATIGPPIFMHRASSPGPTVPRKHHKGENPHETFPVLGASFRYGATWLEASVFSGKELTPADTRWAPHVAAPASYAARVRRVLAGAVELQVSGERLRDQGNGEPDATQWSASLTTWGSAGAWRLDGLLDWAIDVPDAGGNANGALAELAARDGDRRDIFWARSEFNQREEPAERGGGVSTPWLFETLGFERVVAGHRQGLQIGVYGEGTFVHLPSSLLGPPPYYPSSTAVTLDVGLHLFGMWMLDGSFNRMDM